MGAAPARATFSDIRNSKGDVLFRRFNLVTEPLGVPLMILPVGAIESGRYGRYRRVVPPHVSTDGDAVDKALDDAIAVKRFAANGDYMANARQTVQVAFLDSTTATDRSTSPVVDKYMEMLATTTAGPALIERLLADPPVNDLPRAEILYRSFSPEQLNSHLPAIIDKLSMETSEEPQRQNQLGKALEYWPKGAYANPDQETLALLANPELRMRALGLAARMSDMGERGASLVADIVEHHYAKAPPFSNGNWAEVGQRNRGTANAGVRALCRLGAQAAAELPRMRELEGRILLFPLERMAWNIMMAPR
jgi:hypothetical protein